MNSMVVVIWPMGFGPWAGRMCKPWLGGFAVGTPGDEFTNAGDDDKIQQSSDDHYEVLFAGFNFLHVIPGGGVLEGIAAACYQLRLEGMSDNED